MALLCGIGVVFLGIGLWNIIEGLYRAKLCSKMTTGTLIASEEHYDYDPYRARRMCYSPVYMYEVDGKKYTYSPKKYMKNPMNFDVGSTVTIKYCPSNPNICSVKGKNEYGGIASICIIIGAMLTILTIIK